MNRLRIGGSRSPGIRPSLATSCIGLTMLLVSPRVASAAPFAYISGTASYTGVSVIDLATDTVVTTIPNIGNIVVGVAVSPTGNTVYVSVYNSGASGTVAVIDAATNTVTTTIPVGNGPNGVAMHPAGTRVYVANQSDSTMSVIDTASNATIATVPVAPSPRGIAVNPSGTRAYVASESGTVSIIDTATNVVVAGIPVGRSPAGVAVSPDGKHVYVTMGLESPNVLVIDAATNTVAASVPSIYFPVGVAVHPDGSKIYVANFGDSNGNTVSVIDTATNSLTATVTVGLAPTGIAIDPTGARVYVANQSSGSVSVIDTATNTVVNTVSVGDSPVAFGQFIANPGCANGALAPCDGPLSPGGGARASDCMHEWRTSPISTADRHGFPANHLVCGDDDPACDFGPAGDQACTFHVALCFNVSEQRFTCTPKDVERVQLRQPNAEDPGDVLNTGNRDALEAAVAAIGGALRGVCRSPRSKRGQLCVVDADCDSAPGAGNGRCRGRLSALVPALGAPDVCTPFAAIKVPLRFGGTVRGSKTLRLTTRPSVDPITGRRRGADTDALTLVCRPHQ